MTVDSVVTDFGRHVAVDGNYTLVAAFNITCVFERNASGTWVQTATLDAPWIPTESIAFIQGGISLSGNMALIANVMFVRDEAGSWNEQQTLAGSDPDDIAAYVQVLDGWAVVAFLESGVAVYELIDGTWLKTDVVLTEFNGIELEPTTDAQCIALSKASHFAEDEYRIAVGFSTFDDGQVVGGNTPGGRVFVSKLATFSPTAAPTSAPTTAPSAAPTTCEETDSVGSSVQGELTFNASAFAGKNVTFSTDAVSFGEDLLFRDDARQLIVCGALLACASSSII